MAGDPNSIAQRLMKLELQQPQAVIKQEITAEDVTAQAALPAGEGVGSEKEIKDTTGDAEAGNEDEDAAAGGSSDLDEDSDDVEEGAEQGEPDDLDELAGLLTSESRRDRLLGARSLRSRISDRHEAPGYSRLLTSPALAALVANLGTSADQELQFESAWALTNLLAGSGARPADLVTSSGLGSRLIRMLQCAPTERLREQACWALANVAGESPAWRDQLILADDGSGSGGGLLPALISLWESDPGNGLLDASSLLLVNLFRDRRPRLKFEYAQLLMPHVTRLLSHPYDSVVPNLLWALSYAVEGSEPRARLLLRETDAVDCVLGFLESSDDSLLMPTLRLLCCAAACLQVLPAKLLTVFPAVRRLLGHRDAKLRRQALLLLGCTACGPDAQLEAAAQAGCLTALNEILAGRRPQTDDPEDAAEASGGGGSGAGISDLERREAFWIIPDFMLSRAHKFSKRITEECLEGLLASLSLPELEATRCALLCLRHLLFAAKYKNRPDLNFELLKTSIEKLDGLKKIEAMQKIEDKEVIKLSDQILNQYFWGNEKKYLEESSQSQETSPSPVAAADIEVGDDLLDDGDDGEVVCGPDKDGALSSLIGGLQANRD
ncbi:hypothetical protein BOX15_Mlig003063g2 [Macrostomum lignano]|uniref:Importin subunit alpha n=1 Tax=Macrostomum lignano TaxID=282301 RepID=A0A267DZZ2_9PLAT|nr:hypothetical protein BOX15_Mlig003063g2 [Macrostomum lignano]